MPIYIVYALYLVNSISMRAARVVLPLYALDLGAQPFAIGVLAASFSVLPLLLSVPAGKFADRFGSRWLLVMGAVGGGFGMLLPYSIAGLPTIFAAAMLCGMSIGIYQVTLQNMVGLLSTPHNRTRNFSNFSLMAMLSNFVGPLVAGFAIDHFGHITTCLYLALVTLLPIAMFSINAGGSLQASRSKVKAEHGGIRNMLSDPAVRRTLATTSLMHTGQDLYIFYMPVYAHSLGLSATSIGIILASYAVAAAVVRLALPSLLSRLPEEKLLTYAFYMSAASLLMIPLTNDALLLALISLVFGLGTGFSQPIITMIMFSNSAEGRSGEALGLRMAVVHFTKLAGPVAFGIIGSAFGLSSMFWLNAMMMGAGGILSPQSRTRKEQ